MIKVTRAWLDSDGNFHQSREAACKAEFRRLLLEKFWRDLPGPRPEDGIRIDVLVDNMFELDRIFGEATKEDSRVEFADAK